MDPRIDALLEAKRHAEALLSSTTDPQTRVAIAAILADIDKALSYPPDGALLH